MSKSGPKSVTLTSIRTQVPGPESIKPIAREQNAESGANAYPGFFGSGKHSPVFISQEGSCLTDVDGNRFLETSGCYSCGTMGYLPIELIEVAGNQMRQLVDVPDAPTIPRIELSEDVQKIAPGELARGRVRYEVGGSGAIDLALQIAYYYACKLKTQNRHRVMSFWGNYPGRTLGTLSITGSARCRNACRYGKRRCLSPMDTATVASYQRMGSIRAFPRPFWNPQEKWLTRKTSRARNGDVQGHDCFRQNALGKGVMCKGTVSFHAS